MTSTGGGGGGADVDRVFAALADPRRRELLDVLGRSAGCSASSLAAGLPISRQAVAQHLAVLEDSSLVSRKRAGREVLFSVRPEQLAATAAWLTDRAATWARAATSAALVTPAALAAPAIPDTLAIPGRIPRKREAENR